MLPCSQRCHRRPHRPQRPATRTGRPKPARAADPGPPTSPPPTTTSACDRRSPDASTSRRQSQSAATAARQRLRIAARDRPHRAHSTAAYSPAQLMAWAVGRDCVGDGGRWGRSAFRPQPVATPLGEGWDRAGRGATACAVGPAAPGRPMPPARAVAATRSRCVSQPPSTYCGRAVGPQHRATHATPSPAAAYPPPAPDGQSPGGPCRLMRPAAPVSGSRPSSGAPAHCHIVGALAGSPPTLHTQRRWR